MAGRRISSLLGLLPMLLLWAVSPALSADDEGKTKASGPVPHFTDRRFAHKVTDDAYYSIAYPEFGIPYLDEKIRKAVAGFQDGWSLKEFRPPRGENGAILAMSREFGCEISAPKKGVVSIYCSTWSYDAGTPRGYIGVALAGTYDLRREKEVTMGDVFPDWEKGQAGLERLLADLVMGDEDERDIRDDIYLDAFSKVSRLDSILLTEDGLRTINGDALPPPLWGYSTILIPKEDLEEIGADMNWWGEKH